MNTSLSRISLIALILLLFAPWLPYAAKVERVTSQPKVIQLDASGKDYLPVLGGPPESVKMKSGLVVLAHGKSSTAPSRTRSFWSSLKDKAK